MSKLSKKIIGLTGSIASGKSQVSNYLKTNGYKVIDADVIVNDLYENDNNLKEKLITLLGKEIIVDNKINKKIISNLVFNDDKLLKQLNDLIHPLVIDYIKQEINKNNDIIILDVPLLYEAGIDKLCDYTIVIDVDDNIRLERLLKRDGISYEKAVKINDKQLNNKIKKNKADFVIDNNSSLEELYQQVDKVLMKIKEK